MRSQGRRALGPIVAVAIVATALWAQPALAADFTTVGSLVQVSGTSPFAGCTLDDVPGQTGTNFPSSEVEPWIDVNPTDPSNIVGAWQQDRWSNGGSRGHVAGVSTDGGSSWTQVVIPKITLCSGGTQANHGAYQRTTDPWISFGPNGTLYQLSLSFNDISPPFGPGDQQPGGDFDHALLASKSTNGGLTWTDPAVVIRDLDANAFNDKQSITADPNLATNVYAVWDRLVFPTSERASVVASLRSSSLRGPIWFNRSIDGGTSWEQPRQIYDPGQQDQTLGSQIVVLPAPGGALVDMFAEDRNQNSEKLRGWNVRVLRSTDRGVTWSGPIQVGRLRSISVTDPESGDAVRTGDIVPDVAVNETNGRLYAVWQDARFSGFENDSIAFSQSLDGGHTWSSPVKVNKTPTNIPAGDQQAFTASVDVAADGTIGVTYYDFRNNTGGATLPTDYWAIHCHPTTATACTNAANWGDEIRLTDTSFDMLRAPLATGSEGGFFTGDYEGLASAGNDFTAFFSQPHGTDPSSTFFRRLGP
jgi:hypothetical protein